MNDTNVEVLLEMTDNASPKFNAFSQTLSSNRAAFTQLARGVTYLGTTFLSLGVAMQSSNNETLKSMGGVLTMAGSMMMAVGSASYFVAAIGKMVTALKALRVQQILTQAFGGPAGWAALAGGLAVAGGVMYGVSRMEAGATAKAGGGNVQQIVNNNVTVNNAGSVVAERQLTDSIQKGLLQKKQRNYSTGL